MKIARYSKKVVTIVSILIASQLFAMGSTASFPQKYTYNNIVLQKRGSADLKFQRIILAYSGALYLESETSSTKALNNVSKKLELHYFHDIKAKDFVRATKLMVERNTTASELNAIQSELDAFVRLYQDVKQNDRYSLVYVPGTGTSLKLNGRLIGTVKGEELSKALFSMWIGQNPIDKKFRRELLGI